MDKSASILMVRLRREKLGVSKGWKEALKRVKEEPYPMTLLLYLYISKLVVSVVSALPTIAIYLKEIGKPLSKEVTKRMSTLSTA